MKTQGFGCTDAGTKRKDNDDSFIASEELGLYAVCDGTRGAERTAEVAVQALLKHVRTSRSQIDSAVNPDKVGQLLELAIQEANLTVVRALETAKVREQGTTLDVALIRGNRAWIGHVGDGRVYLFRLGKLHLLTEDHSFVQEMVKSGKLSLREARESPFANLVTRVLGAQKYVKPDVLQVELMPGDVLVLCSDGVSDPLTHDDLLKPFSTAHRAAQPVAEALLGTAKAKSGADNLTVVVIRCENTAAIDTSAHAVTPPPAPSAARGAKAPIAPGGATSTAVGADLKIEALAKIPMFRHFGYNELVKVLNIAQTRSFEAGAEMVTEGFVSDEMFVILSGAVNVMKGGKHIATRRRGDSIGEMGLIDNAPRSASAVATEKTHVLALGKPSLFALLRVEAPLAVKFFWAMCLELNSRLREATSQLTSSSSDGSSGLLEELPFRKAGVAEEEDTLK